MGTGNSGEEVLNIGWIRLAIPLHVKGQLLEIRVPLEPLATRGSYFVSKSSGTGGIDVYVYATIRATGIYGCAW